MLTQREGIKVPKRFRSLIDTTLLNGYSRTNNVGTFLTLKRNKELMDFIDVIPDRKCNAKSFLIVNKGKGLTVAREYNNYLYYKKNGKQLI